MKRYELKGLNWENVFGEPVDEENVYIRTYGVVLPGWPAVESLSVGMDTRKEYRLSGQKPTTYIILRVS